MTKFRDLPLHATFDFIGPGRFNSFFDRCIKTGTRVYHSVDRPTTAIMHVGSINCDVFHVEQPIAGHRATLLNAAHTVD